jgi:DNA topoisomerase I
MAKNLLIVESPAKAKTIEKILGADFEVKSSYGHIRDLEKDEMGIDIHNNYLPRYKISDDKQKVVSELKSLVKKSNEVWLATDEDREGEAISWHLCEVLGLDPNTTKRIVFHEITKPAIQKAVANPRLVNMNLVNAQQARRVLDRIVGFELSPVLWRKISMRNNLSAGRVQSVAVRLIAEREREINQFSATSSFKLDAIFSANDNNNRLVNFKAEGAKQNNEADAAAFLESCKGANYTVSDIQIKPGKRTPAAPFTTSTLQQEASRKLGYGVSKTMLIAQKLYESGKISYMRTDSVSLSETAIEDISNAINKNFGNKYLQTRKYKNKNESAQEAHEAIRPTYMENSTIDDFDGKRLYELIWKRTIASQMSDAELEKTIAKIDISTNGQNLKAEGEVIKFDGFLKVYMEDKDEEEDTAEGDNSLLPPLKVKQVLDLKELKATERFSRPQPRYTEASLVKKLEELGIGRPSTYAPTISTVQKRGYVEKKDKDGIKRDFRVLKLTNNTITKVTEQENTGAEKSKLFPTDLGLVVTDFLMQHFKAILDYGFTAKVEGEFDEVATGKTQWHKMIDNFYHPFHKDIEETIENAQRQSGERDLGVDATTGKKVIARMGRFGPMVQIGDSSDENDKPKFAKLKSTQSIETITFDEAMDLFKLPLTLGTYNNEEVLVNIGRFGPYVKYGEQFVSLPKGEEPLEVTLERAIEVIEAKLKEDAAFAYYKELPITKGKGRFGPYIKWNGLFINIPRAYNFDTLTQSDCDALIEKKIEKEDNRFIQQWPTDKIALENGRWGPFIRFGKKMLKLRNKEDGSKYTAEDLAVISLEEVKKLITAVEPNAFVTKAKKTATKAAAKKAPTKKAVPKKK